MIRIFGVAEASSSSAGPRRCLSPPSAGEESLGQTPTLFPPHTGRLLHIQLPQKQCYNAQVIELRPKSRMARETGALEFSGAGK